MTKPRAGKGRPIEVIDSHTEGEPTRVVIAGGPPLPPGHPSELRTICRRDYDHFRSAIVNEPRGSDVLVGAYLVPPTDPAYRAGVIFFNNVGMIGMCGHGTIGLIATLAWLGRIEPGEHRLQTPVGDVSTLLHDDGRVTVRNVPSYRLAARVPVHVDGHGTIHGDIAWGGNWFFLIEDHRQFVTRAHVEHLVDFTWRVRQALERQRITGADGAPIDHVELTGRSPTPGRDGRNFVLCPGKAYDRSPCGTGTSARLACLAADAQLRPGEVWRQEGILGTMFEGTYEEGENGQIIPSITGTAHITAESTLWIGDADPLAWGLPPDPPILMAGHQA